MFAPPEQRAFEALPQHVGAAKAKKLPTVDVVLSLLSTHEALYISSHVIVFQGLGSWLSTCADMSAHGTEVPGTTAAP